jgi:dTDP-glucose 4,6-dehydratase
MNTDWDVVCPVSFEHRGLPERITASVDHDEWWQRITVINCDLAACINDTTRALFGPIDYIINYASNSHVDRSITHPKPFIQNNISLVLNLLEYAREARPAAFVQISTDEVYGPAEQGRDYEEWASIVPSNPYSASKAAQEAIAISYWRTYAVPVIITNCMNLIGEMQDPEKFVPMTISKVLRGETVDIHASTDGQIGSRYYLHARNLADAVLFLLHRGEVSMYADGADRPDRWHIVGEREVSNLEMAQLIAGFMERELHYRLTDFHASRPGHDLRYALDGSKLEAAGWKRPVPFEDSLATLIAWTLRHPLWADRVAAP